MATVATLQRRLTALAKRPQLLRHYAAAPGPLSRKKARTIIGMMAETGAFDPAYSDCCPAQMRALRDEVLWPIWERAGMLPPADLSPAVDPATSALRAPYILVLLDGLKERWPDLDGEREGDATRSAERAGDEWPEVSSDENKKETDDERLGLDFRPAAGGE